MSALAVAALIVAVIQGVAVIALLLGIIALRRIERSRGALRGDAVAGLAIVIGVARLAVAVVQRL